MSNYATLLTGECNYIFFLEICYIMHTFIMNRSFDFFTSLGIHVYAELTVYVHPVLGICECALTCGGFFGQFDDFSA